ncbi:MAG: hypothetical protein KC731_32965, partial [Myxococcales bacterium]|nr:hypothetical protein [Myxococcales bacterium]
MVRSLRLWGSMRKGARHVGVGLGLLGALAWGACKGPEEAVLAALGSGCVLDSDCEGELVCVFQRCHQACETSVDCPRGERCVVGAPPTHVCLLEDETECVRNSDCPEVLICASDRKCRDECVADPDCLGDQVCAQQACALEAELVEGRLPEVEPDPEPSCAFDSECVFPKRCIDEVCRFECEVDADCPSQRCEDNRCDPLGPVAPTCVPGHQQGCACPTSGTGVQICADDGLGYGDCLGCGGMMGTAGACPPTGMMSDPSFVWGRALTFPAGLATTSAVMAHQSGDVVLAGTTTLPTDLGGQVVSPANGVDAFLARYGAGGSLQGVTTYDAGTGSVEVSAL